MKYQVFFASLVFVCLAHAMENGNKNGKIIAQELKRFHARLSYFPEYNLSSRRYIQQYINNIENSCFTDVEKDNMLRIIRQKEKYIETQLEYQRALYYDGPSSKRPSKIR